MEQGISLVFLYKPKETQVSEELTTSANMSEVADPTETQGAEEQEFAEPAEEETAEEQYAEDTEDNEDEQSEQDKANAAFAEMRRRAEEAEKEKKELEEKLAQQERDSEKQSELANAVAYARENGFSDEEIEELLAEVQAEQEAEDEYNSIVAENERLKKQVEELEDLKLQFEYETMAQSDLRELQKIDPELTDLDDLGHEFVVLRSMGTSPERAYYMIKSADEATKPRGAYAPGKINKAKQEAEYYTSEELDALSDEEIKANWEKVQRSMNRL